MPGYHAGYMRNMLPAIEIQGVSSVAAVNGAGVDMQGWDGVAFEILMGIIGNGGTFDARVTESANANFSGEVNIAGAASVQLPNTQPNVVVTIDVFRPTNRYVRLIATPGTNNSNFAVVSHRYRSQGRTPGDLTTNHQYVAVRAN